MRRLTTNTSDSGNRRIMKAADYSLKKMMEKPERLAPGHRMCAGCGATIGVRAVLRALHEEDRAVIGNATGCLEVSSYMYPYSAWEDSYIHNAFENAGATLRGVETAYKALKKKGKLTGKDKESIGVALSDSGFSSYLRIEDIICILRKMYPTFDEAFFRKNCEVQRLAFDKRIKEFSTGMRAKLRVLVAISHKSQLLIMDEPTSGLDIQARNDILDLLRQYLLANDNCSILITSHISSDLEGLCDDIYLLHDGKIIFHEDTDTLLDSYAILKMNEDTYGKLDKSHVLATKKEQFGYACFTDEKRFYAHKYPDIVIENGSIDDMILMLTGGR